MSRPISHVSIQYSGVLSAVSCPKIGGVWTRSGCEDALVSLLPYLVQHHVYIYLISSDIACIYSIYCPIPGVFILCIGVLDTVSCPETGGVRTRPGCEDAAVSHSRGMQTPAGLCGRNHPAQVLPCPKKLRIGTLSPEPYTPNPKPQTPNPRPQTPDLKPQTPDPKPKTSNPTGVPRS